MSSASAIPQEAQQDVMSISPAFLFLPLAALTPIPPASPALFAYYYCRSGEELTCTSQRGEFTYYDDDE